MSSRSYSQQRAVRFRFMLPFLALAIPGTALANIDPPSGPTNSADGNYTITYNAGIADNYCSVDLQQKAPGSPGWLYINDDGDGIVAFQNQPTGIYEYRVYAECEDYYGEESWEIISSSISVLVGELPDIDALSEQLTYTYQTRIGDINGDQLNDIFVTRTSGGESGNGALGDFFLLQNGNGSFTPSSANAGSANIALGWPMALLGIARTDINIDGFVDLVISDIDYFIPGSSIQFVYSSGELFNETPQAVIPLTAEIQQFQEDFEAWTDDPNYFDNNAVWVEEPGYWAFELECEIFWWGSSPEWDCEYVPVWVDGDEYLDYSAFNQDALDLAIAIGRILAGDTVTVADVIKILERVFGVKIGGWNFGGWLPGGVSLGASDLYSFSLSLESTRNVITGETPACIANNIEYFQARINNYLEPDDFVLRIDQVITQYSLADLTGSSANPIWNHETYTYMYGLPVTNAISGDFGFFDARHATYAFKLGEQTSQATAAVILFEFWWELRQAARGLCQTAGLLEDIVSNHVGAKTAERYDTNPGNKTPGQHMEDILHEWAGLPATRTQAISRLNSQGIFP